MTLGSPVVCCVCNAAAVAAEVVVAAAAAAAAAGSLAAMRTVAKELVRVCSLGTCANALQVVSSGAVEIVTSSCKGWILLMHARPVATAVL